MNTISSLAQQWRFSRGLRWQGKYPPPPTRFLFRAAIIAAVAVMAITNQDLKARAEIMEKVVEAYEPAVKVLKDCEAGAVGYYYKDGRAFECAKPL